RWGVPSREGTGGPPAATFGGFSIFDGKPSRTPPAERKPTKCPAQELQQQSSIWRSMEPAGRVPRVGKPPQSRFPWTGAGFEVFRPASLRNRRRATLQGLPTNGEELRHDRHQLIPTPQGRAVRVLVGNDSPDNVESMALLLRLYGQEVEVALGGPAALRTAQAQQPDAVLHDLSMPGMDGYQVAGKLRAMFRDKPLLLVAITAH